MFFGSFHSFFLRGFSSLYLFPRLTRKNIKERKRNGEKEERKEKRKGKEGKERKLNDERQKAKKRRRKVICGHQERSFYSMNDGEEQEMEKKEKI